jgi:hypothetical protein
MEELVPFQVQLERRQHARLKSLAEARGRSMGSMIRESVAVYLADQPVEDDPAYGIIGLFEDTGDLPHGDVGVNHDAYLADASWAEGHPDDPAAP